MKTRETDTYEILGDSITADKENFYVRKSFARWCLVFAWLIMLTMRSYV